MLLDIFPCAECDKRFSTRQALQAHSWMQHQRISLERQYVDGPVCRACGVLFWTSQRVQQHLRQSRKNPDGCFHKLFHNFEPSQIPVRWTIQSPWRHIHNLPQSYVGGENSSLASTPEELRARRLGEWSQRWAAQGYPEEIPDQTYVMFKDGMQCATLAWLCDPSGDLLFNWGSFFDRFAAKVQVSSQTVEWCFYIWYRFDLEDAIDHVSQSLQNQVICDARDLFVSFTIHELLHQLVEINAAGNDPPPLPEIGPSAKGTHDRLDGHVIHWYSRQNELMHKFANAEIDHQPALPGVPFLLDKEGQKWFIITHLFSGRRRAYDCHHWLETLGPRYLPGWKFLLLSFDTAVHPQLGNLDEGPNWHRVLRLAMLKVIAANITGPPCETFSAARHLQPTGVPGRRLRWPRPLRHPCRLWGLDGLAHRELRQLHMGSRLLLHSARFEAYVVLGGGGSAMEHPAPRKDPEVPSSFAAPIMTKYLAHLNARKHYIEQYRFGAVGIKPTLLRSLNLSRFQHLREAEDPMAQRPSQGLRGLDEQGNWRTSSPKNILQS